MKKLVSFPHKISKEELKQLYNCACNSWKIKLSNLYGASLIIDEPIEIPEYLYKDAMESCPDIHQKNIINNIFGEEEKYKIGDYVITEGYVNQYDGKVLLITRIVDEYYHFRIKGSEEVRLANFALRHIKRHATREEIDMFNCPYSEGDAVAVKDSDCSLWVIRYTTGRITKTGLEVYKIQNKTGDTITFKFYKRLKDF